MNTAINSRAKITPQQTATTELKTVKPPNSTPIKPTSQTRNFGWLVRGMVEVCHQISADDLI